MGTKPTKLTLVGTRITYQAIGDAGMHHTNMCVRKRKDGDKNCILLYIGGKKRKANPSRITRCLWLYTVLHFAFEVVLRIILVRTPPLGTKGVERGARPPGVASTATPR